MVCCKICFFKVFNSWKMLKMLKIGCFKLFKAKSLFLRYTSRYFHAIFCSTVVKVRLLWPVSHIFTVFPAKFVFLDFSIAGKMLKMLKIGCFKQNHCISGMPQGIPMQFFAQQWWKSGYCDQFHTYSQWFAAKFVFLYFSTAGKCSKCLK